MIPSHEVVCEPFSLHQPLSASLYKQAASDVQKEMCSAVQPSYIPARRERTHTDALADGNVPHSPDQLEAMTHTPINQSYFRFTGSINSCGIRRRDMARNYVLLLPAKWQSMQPCHCRLLS